MAETASRWYEHVHQMLVRLEDRVWEPPREQDSRSRRAAQRYLQIVVRSVQSFIECRGAPTASALTYTTLLTVVPFLAIILPLLKAAGVYENAYTAMLRLIDTQLPPGGAGSAMAFRDNVLAFVNQLRDFVNHTNLRSLGIFGVGGLLLAVLSLFSRIELAMNDAWGVARSRSVVRKVIDYLGLLLVLVFLLAALSLTATGGFLSFAHRWGEFGFNYLQALLLKFIPLLVAWPTFTLLYHFMPNTWVRWRAAVVSGLATGLLFQAMQFVFFRFHSVLDGYNKLYGAFAYLVILFVMIFASWCIVLWGVHFCSAYQNLGDLRRRRRPWRNSPAERETLALRLAALLARDRLQPLAAPPDAGRLADTLNLPPGPVGELLGLFLDHGLVILVEALGGYRLLRDPETVSALDLLRLVREQPADRLHAHPHLYLHAHEDEAPRADAPGQGTGNDKGPLAELSRGLAEPLRRLSLRELAELPLEQIVTFRF